VHASIDILVVTAGYFVSETFEEPRWAEEVRMYTTCAVGPLFIVQALVAAGKIRTNLGVPGGGEGGEGGKVVLVSSESGSIGLRHAKEGGGNYAHHASKSALNMVGKLLSLDIAERGIAVAIVHVRMVDHYFSLLTRSQPGFMRTDMTKNVGYDQYWDTGGGLHFFSTDLSLFDLPHSRDAGGSRRLSHPLHRYFHNRDDRAILGSPRRTVHIVVSPGTFQLTNQFAGTSAPQRSSWGRICPRLSNYRGSRPAVLVQ
jgi:NAD(P)-dependent dehydrogenase (short-subunit alcohol dehydrogenase family)